jgi:hypothetical protein
MEWVNPVSFVLSSLPQLKHGMMSAFRPSASKGFTDVVEELFLHLMS